MTRDERTTTQKGYGWAHQQARKRALSALIDGQPCVRCGKPMYRSDGPSLDLDHDDGRTAYNGLAHSACNRRAGQAKAMRGRAPRTRSTQPTPRSRNW